MTIRKKISMDGNNAAAHVSYAFTEVAGIYPITPSSSMAEYVDKWSAEGKKNVFGQTVRVVEMQSEGGAAGTVHGSLSAGALTTTYTASQGLLLMIPNMYKISGELLPGVMHVSARALASHALSIFGDHSDVMACRQTGFALLCSGRVQEVMDLGAIAHLAAIKSRIPFAHFFDGFRTSHEIQKIEAWDYADLAEMLDMDAVDAFRERALNPEKPVLRGSAQNPDIFFQAREASNSFYLSVPAIVEEYMDKVNAKIGTDYKLFNYYGDPDAEKVIVAMGSVCDTAEETIDYLLSKGEKVGLVKVRLYRPFAIDRFVESIPATAKKIAVLDRTKEPGAIGEPLYLDVVAALRGTDFEKALILGGRYGLGSKDTTPGDIIAVYRNLDAKTPVDNFTISIVDDITHKSLAVGENPDTSPAGTVSCKFWGLGSDGTVGANKNSIKIIGDHTEKHIQAYFAYDSKKSGGITISHLRFGDKPIRSAYYVSRADFVACHNPAYMGMYDITADLKENGTFLLNCQWTPEEIAEKLPAKAKRDLAAKNAKFYIVDAISIAKSLGLGGRTNTVLQSAFFKLAGIIPTDDAVEYMKKAAYKSFIKKGQAVVDMNYAAIDAGVSAAIKIDVPESWKKAVEPPAASPEITGELGEFVEKILIPINRQDGDSLPVSTFTGREDGTLPLGSAAFEKRGVAVDVPEWNPDNCIQCNFCAFVCPHATIRPVALTEKEAEAYPDFPLLPMTAMPGYKFGITVSILDCMGCGSCAQVCPGKKGEKALTMKPAHTQIEKQPRFTAAYEHADNKEVLAKFKPETVKGSQFKQPLLEFSGACAGCGETPYARLITQLYGDRMLIANATGCSSIWGGSAPSIPYTVNKDGKGPAWANSLFEDNAEYGYGMATAIRQRREKLIEIIEKFATSDYELISTPSAEWLKVKDNGEASKTASAALIDALENAVAECGDCGCGFDSLYRQALAMKDLFVKRSVWIFGGDGWAYDIGFGGLDHVLAMGEDINVFVFDTEVYSNTGGQASKATPTGSVAQFAAAGKPTKKKDLAAIAMSYGYVYVAQVAMGADYNQCIKAITEAEAYPGPSIIIGYSPCINHGIKKGLGTSMLETKAAVAAGYWHTFRYNPQREAEGLNPFVLDSKEPGADYKEFINNESRYSSLKLFFPERAQVLFDRAEDEAKEKYKKLKKLADG